MMHPGSINRGGRELSSEARHFQRSVILNQVENGIAVRMGAVLEKVITMAILTKNGRVIDPHRKTDQVADVLIAEGRIVGVGSQNLSFGG